MELSSKAFSKALYRAPYKVSSKALVVKGINYRD